VTTLRTEGARLVVQWRQHLNDRTSSRLAALDSAMGRFCCKSRKIACDKNRRESWREGKTLLRGVVTPLRKSLVV
jgi:hypothetical protein